MFSFITLAFVLRLECQEWFAAPISVCLGRGHALLSWTLHL